jgi:hypothetical protein
VQRLNYRIINLLPKISDAEKSVSTCPFVCWDADTSFLLKCLPSGWNPSWKKLSVPTRMLSWRIAHCWWHYVPSWIDASHSY